MDMVSSICMCQGSDGPTKVTRMMDYRKVPKFSDARKLCCNLPKIQEKRPKHLGILSK